MQPYLLDMLECPACHGRLEWSITEASNQRIELAEAQCAACGATYPIRDGIGLFLTPDLPRNDLWEQVDNQLLRYLRSQPALEKQLLESPMAVLNPADQFLRSLVLEGRGSFTEAQNVEATALANLYSEPFKRCWTLMSEALLEHVSSADGALVDLASGRCYLAKRLLSDFQRPVVITDFSPGVLRRNRLMLESLGLYDRASLLAFDARCTPFKDGAVGILTTNVGLPNIEEPGQLLVELRRIVSGEFLSISHFFPEDDEANGQVIRQAGLQSLLYQSPAQELFVDAGWCIKEIAACEGPASPTPTSAIIEGLKIDSLPASDTVLSWHLWAGD